MIKIIKEGTRKIAKCPNCGCEFSYEREDIEKDGLLANNSVFIGKAWVVCPQCGKEIVLETPRSKEID